MDQSDYLRDQACRYRQLAEAAGDSSAKAEILNLATACGEVANEIEDLRAAG